MHYYIQFGPVYDTDDAQKVVEECIATELIERRGMTKWIDLISSAHLQVRWSPLRLQPQGGAAQLTPCGDHAGSREENQRDGKRRGGQQRPGEVALGVLQVLQSNNGIR